MSIQLFLLVLIQILLMMSLLILSNRITRIYMLTPAISCSKRNSGIWVTPEVVISQSAGEQILDKEGNIYLSIITIKMEK